MTSTKFKFIFANTDLKMEYEASNAMTVLELKRWLIQEWAKDSGRPEPPEPEGMRLICMGGAMDDKKTISECKLPSFGQTIIPVNVSMLPKGQKYSTVPMKSESTSKPKTTASSSNSNNAASGSGNNNGSSGGANRNSRNASSSCCTIL